MKRKTAATIRPGVSDSTSRELRPVTMAKARSEKCRGALSGFHTFRPGSVGRGIDEHDSSQQALGGREVSEVMLVSSGRGVQKQNGQLPVGKCETGDWAAEHAGRTRGQGFCLAKNGTRVGWGAETPYLIRGPNHSGRPDQSRSLHQISPC